MQKIRYHTLGLITVSLALVIALLVGYFIQLKIEKETIRSAVKTKIFEGLDRSALVFIALSNENDPSFQWKEELEFSLHGNCYDIVESTSYNGEQGYWCWLDKDESDVEVKINALCALRLRNHPAAPSRELTIETLLNSLYFHANDGILISEKKPTLFKITTLTEPLNTVDHLPTTPPPEHG